jgi:RNA polymerase sigma-70 factor (sigma-E family)
MLKRTERAHLEHVFEQIVVRTTPRLRHIAYLFSGNWSDAEDLTQTAYLKAYRHIQRVCTVDAPDAYLKQILVRTCIDRARKRKAQEIITDVVPDLGTTDDTNDEKWAVRAALAKVPVSQREILILRFYADMSVVETAAALGCSTGNVKSQTSRGLVALAQHLGVAKSANDGEAS